MINGSIRPWGDLSWLLKFDAISRNNWYLIGSITPQERSTSILEHAISSFQCCGSYFLDIQEPENPFSPDYENLKQAAINRWFELTRNSPNHKKIELNLDSPMAELKSIIDKIKKNQPSIILDVSCLPERFFFPILRWLCVEDTVKNLIVTCMSGEFYTQEDLAYDPADWAHIPTFVGRVDISQIAQVIVGVGFLPFNLSAFLKSDFSDRQIDVKAIIPFPSPSQNYKRAWEFVRLISDDVQIDRSEQLLRCDAFDTSGCFDKILRATEHGKISTTFAPYGPKAHSVAIALFSIKFDASVSYTQPNYYHPYYTQGCPRINGLPKGTAYSVKANGIDLYKVNTNVSTR